jgi:hypothetical protein
MSPACSHPSTFFGYDALSGYRFESQGVVPFLPTFPAPVAKAHLTYPRKFPKNSDGDFSDQAKAGGLS